MLRQSTSGVSLVPKALPFRGGRDRDLGLLHDKKDLNFSFVFLLHPFLPRTAVALPSLLHSRRHLGLSETSSPSPPNPPPPTLKEPELGRHRQGGGLYKRIFLVELLGPEGAEPRTAEFRRPLHPPSEGDRWLNR